MEERTARPAPPNPSDSYCPGCVMAARRHLGMDLPDPDGDPLPCALHAQPQVVWLDGQECTLAEAELFVGTWRPALWN